MKRLLILMLLMMTSAFAYEVEITNMQGAQLVDETVEECTKLYISKNPRMSVDAAKKACAQDPTIFRRLQGMSASAERVVKAQIVAEESVPELQEIKKERTRNARSEKVRTIALRTVAQEATEAFNTCGEGCDRLEKAQAVLGTRLEVLASFVIRAEMKYGASFTPLLVEIDELTARVIQSEDKESFLKTVDEFKTVLMKVRASVKAQMPTQEVEVKESTVSDVDLFEEMEKLLNNRMLSDVVTNVLLEQLTYLQKEELSQRQLMFAFQSARTEEFNQQLAAVLRDLDETDSRIVQKQIEIDYVVKYLGKWGNGALRRFEWTDERGRTASEKLSVAEAEELLTLLETHRDDLNSQKDRIVNEFKESLSNNEVVVQTIADYLTRLQ